MIFTMFRPGYGRNGRIYGVKPGSQHRGLFIPRDSENHFNVGQVSIWYIKEPLWTTSTLAVTTLSVSIERSAWRKCSEKD